MKTKTFTHHNAGWTAWAGLILTGLIAMSSMPGLAAVGTWATIQNFPNSYSHPGQMMLLSDGSVMIQNMFTTGWYRLAPDSQGHYLNGNWSQLASMKDARHFYASQVLQSGKVLVAGGEYGDGTNGGNGEIYDPIADIWTSTPPTGVGLGDAESIMLPNGEVLVGPVGAYDGSEAYVFLYDPSANQWSPGTKDLWYQNEATWVKLPDGTILTVDIWNNGNTSERYFPNDGNLTNWFVEPNLAVTLMGGNSEVGGAYMMADGRAFWLGGSGLTAFYTPTGNTNQGQWTPGPDMPYFSGNISIWNSNSYVATNYSGLLSAQDSPSAMMVNGHILCQFACDSYHSQTWFYEYDPSVGNFVAAPCPTNATQGTPFLPQTKDRICDETSMVDLPDGTVLYNDDKNLYIYTPSGAPLASGTPTINSIAWNLDGSLHLTGTLFNGISQGASYGDDAQQDSNYPLVRFTDGSGNVTYGRTYNWSSTGVQTGGQIVTTECTNFFDAHESYSVQVVANGNASAPVTFFNPVWVDFNYTGSTSDGNFATPYKTFSAGTNAVSSGGTIAINGTEQPSTGHETVPYKIITPMTLVSFGGSSTIGN